MRQSATRLISRSLFTAALAMGTGVGAQAVDFNFCYNPDTNCKNKGFFR